MKKLVLLVLIIFSILAAAPYQDMPVKVTQPDGSTLDLLASGDEFFNYLHDENDYTIVQSQEDGYYYYALSSEKELIPSEYRVDSSNPDRVGLEKYARISQRKYDEIREFFTQHERVSRAPHDGSLNNLVVFIKFADDTEFSSNRSYFDGKFNGLGSETMQDYYNEVSYGMLEITSTYYPECEMSTNLSYTDSHERGYFQPYNQWTNPNGYTGGNNGSERIEREHKLLQDAIESIASQIPTDLAIDNDNDGYVDNVCFVVRGGEGGWNDLLWAHRWSLFTRDVFINDKQVFDYTFQPETQNEVNVLCHEMFHALGAPDLYHYSGQGPTAAGPWDIMDGSFTHMGAWMKYRYSSQTWISEIPTITESGTYTINPLLESDNNCYIIQSPNSTEEIFVVEYRKFGGFYESSIPGEGLLVYRINTSLYGNASGPPDEVYIYRPGGTTNANGYLYFANFSQDAGRTEINDTTDPSSFLTDGSAGGLNISNISSTGETMTFDVELSSLFPPQNLGGRFYSEDNGATYTKLKLWWDEPLTGADSYKLYQDGSLIEENLTTNNILLDKPADNESHTYTVKAVVGSEETVSSNEVYFPHFIVDPTVEYFHFDSSTMPDSFVNLGTWELTQENTNGEPYALSDSPGGNYGDNVENILYLGHFVEHNAYVIVSSHYELEASCDFLYVEQSTDNSTWTPIITFTGISDGWEQEYVSVETEDNLSYSLRLRMTSDGGINDDGVYINSIYLPPHIGIDDEEGTLPANITLYSNYPNPFNPETTIKFSLPEMANVKLSVYNANGALVETLTSGNLDKGLHTVSFNAEKYNSGVYYYRLESTNFNKTQKMLLLK